MADDPALPGPVWRETQLAVVTAFTFAAGVFASVYAGLPDNGIRRWMVAHPTLVEWVLPAAGLTLFIVGPGCLALYRIMVHFRREHAVPGVLPEVLALQFTPLLQVAHELIVRDGCRADGHKARIRVTLFIMDFSSGRLVQAARYCWDGNSKPSTTSVEVGTGDVGKAWTRGDVQYLSGLETGGFIEALLMAGVRVEDANAHRRRDALTMASAPIFPTHNAQIALKAPGRKSPVAPIAVLSVDAAVANCLKLEWHQDVAQVVFPALATAMTMLPDAERRGAILRVQNKPGG